MKLGLLNILGSELFLSLQISIFMCQWPMSHVFLMNFKWLVVTCAHTSSRKCQVWEGQMRGG